MFWLLPVMVLDVVDEAIVNAKVVRALRVYSSTVTVPLLRSDLSALSLNLAVFPILTPPFLSHPPLRSACPCSLFAGIAR